MKISIVANDCLYGWLSEQHGQLWFPCFRSPLLLPQAWILPMLSNRINAPCYEQHYQISFTLPHLQLLRLVLEIEVVCLCPSEIQPRSVLILWTVNSRCVTWLSSHKLKRWNLQANAYVDLYGILYTLECLTSLDKSARTTMICYSQHCESRQYLLKHFYDQTDFEDQVSWLARSFIKTATKKC